MRYSATSAALAAAAQTLRSLLRLAASVRVQSHQNASDRPDRDVRILSLFKPGGPNTQFSRVGLSGKRQTAP